MGRPKKTTPTCRVSLSLDEADHDLLQAWALEAGKHEATLAAQVVIEVLRAAADDRGQLNIQLIESALAALRGDQVHPPVDQARWRWPLDVLLADRKLWGWYPELCALMGRRLQLPRPSRMGAGDNTPVLDREGYADLLEFLFPAVATTGGVVTWRSTDYPAAVEAARGPQAEDSLPFRPTWERVIRHVVKALDALERSQSGGAGDPQQAMIIEDQLTHGWLVILKNLVGEGHPAALPEKRLS